MTRAILGILTVVTALYCLGQPREARAAITISGNVEPNEPATWDSLTDAYLGRTSDGSLSVTMSDDLLSHDAYIGYEDGVPGRVIVADAGSSWTNSNSLSVGFDGSGTLEIVAAGTISSVDSRIGCNSGSTGVVKVDGGMTSWANSGALNVGLSGNGSLNVTSGGSVTSIDGGIGSNSGSTGFVTIDGTSSKWTNSGDLTVAYAGQGTLSLTSGGKASNVVGYVGRSLDSTGRVTISGTGSKWTNSSSLYVGNSGDGTLSVEAGGQVSCTKGYLGYNAGSIGTATVTGANSKWTNSSYDLYVGYFGNGTLNILAGGAVTSNGTSIGCQSDSAGVVNIDGTGSLWTDSSSVSVGSRGIGTLNITGGARVNAMGYIGNSSTSTGVVSVDGAGSKWTSQAWLVVGDYGHATLNITGRGAVQNVTGTVGRESGSVGEVTVSGAGSNWTNTSELVVGGSGRGSLLIAEGGVVNCGEGRIGKNSGSTGIVTVDGSSSIWNNTGGLMVGWSGSGTLNIQGGARVTVGEVTNICYAVGSTGTINFGPGGGTFTTRSFTGSLTALTGTGTVNTRGLVSDIDLVFDSAASLRQSVAIEDQPGQHINLHFDLATDPSTNGILGAGLKDNGSLRICGGTLVESQVGYLGYRKGSTGVATIAYSGSSWTAEYFNIGYDGNGILNITDGAIVSAKSSPISSSIGRNAGSTGAVHVDGSGSKWTVPSSLRVGEYGYGLLEIVAGGALSTGSVQIGDHAGVKGTMIVSGLGSTWTNSGSLFVGPDGNGTLCVSSGGLVRTATADIGRDSAYSKGVVTVTGSGSAWLNDGLLYIGKYGRGVLNVLDGAVVNNEGNSYLGDRANSAGVVLVDGLNSTWNDTAAIYVGNSGIGAMTVACGGLVTMKSLSISNLSLVAIDVGNHSKLSVNSGAGTITNNGKIRILAGAGASTSVAPYTPISAGAWTGTGIYQGVGGKWDSVAHNFTVYDAVEGAAETEIAVDLFDKQRLTISDAATGWSLGASFLAPASTKTLRLTATPIGGAVEAGLEPLLDGDTLVGGWQFAVGSGYATGEPAYLSFDAGAGHTRYDFAVWKLDGTAWVPYDATDLTYDGQYASFTVADLSPYAISAVPEPASILLLGSGGLLGLFGWRRRVSHQCKRS